MRKPKFEDIAKIGKTFDLEFNLPPFDGDTNECFFDIHKFKETKEFQEFIGIINKLEIPYEYAKQTKNKKSKKIFLTINKGDIDGL
jgi:hypothetical protein